MDGNALLNLSRTLLMIPTWTYVNDSANGNSRALYLGANTSCTYPERAQQAWNCRADLSLAYAIFVGDD